jgi:hypothetical protein
MDYRIILNNISSNNHQQECLGIQYPRILAQLVNHSLTNDGIPAPKPATDMASNQAGNIFPRLRLRLIN